MRVLIDGYNLLHAVWPAEARQLRARARPRFRQRLIERLRKRANSDRGELTVVFDSTRSPSENSAEPVEDGVTVRYAAGYPSADELIEELIRSDSVPAQLMVVSDDRRLQDAARRRGCIVSGCLDFFETLDRPETVARLPEEPTPKDDRLDPDEIEHWLREFGDSADEP
jgi:hypothetical protein